MDTIKLEQIIREKYGNTGAIIVQKNGVSVYEYYENECTKNSPFHVFSVTKSILSILIGIAIDKGYIKSIHQPILDFFPDYIVKKREKTIQSITLYHMMTMTAPYKYKYAPYTKYFTSEDWVKSSLDLLGGKGKIGEFRYAPVIGPDIFSGIIENTTAMTVLNFAKKYLFEPLEIEVPGDIIFHNKEEHSFAALGDGGNVIYINPKENMVIIIASYFKPRVEDRMKLIKEYIEPMWKK